MQEADRMSVAIHPSETRRSEAPRSAPAPSRLRAVAVLALGGGALAAFTAGAFSFFSGLADPRSRPAQVAPARAASVASQWPDLKDGVPALAAASAAESARINLPPAEPAPRTEPAPVTAAAPPPALPARAESPRPEPARIAAVAPPGRPNLPIEPAATLAPARAAAAVIPAKVAAPLAPSRAETVRAKEEQPARFVSLPAKARTEPTRAETVKAEVSRAEAARKPVPAARTRVMEAKASDAPAAAPAPAAPADDEPELLGMKIPGGRQIRAGWNAAVDGLIGKE